MLPNQEGHGFIEIADAPDEVIRERLSLSLRPRGSRRLFVWLRGMAAERAEALFSAVKLESSWDEPVELLPCEDEVGARRLAASADFCILSSPELLAGGNASQAAVLFPARSPVVWEQI